MQNIVIFFMSTFPPAKTTKSHLSKKILFSLKHLWHFPRQRHIPTKDIYNKFHDSTGAFSANCIHTNETAVKYFDWKLQQQNEKIDHVLAIVTDKAKEQLPKFEYLFPNKNFEITPIELNGEINMDQSFHTVSNLFSETMKQIADPTNTTIHIDFTGGLRHTAMLLLALMQMFKFAGVRTGLVTYTNFQSKKIEDATPLVNMFTLIGGTNEFKSFGVANHIQEYFDNIPEISPSLSKLIDAIQVFSDKIKVCSNVKSMSIAINELRENLNIYNQYLNSEFSQEPQEKLFSKLLPYIENDFQKLINKVNTPVYELELIRWCLKKELLQQAATLYTQWIPKFMFKNQLITLLDNDTKKMCKELGKNWSSWEIALLKKYTYQNVSLNKNFNIINLRKFLETSPDLTDVVNFIPESEIKLKTYFETALALSNYQKDEWYNFFEKLPDDHIMIQCLIQTKKDLDLDLHSYIEKLIKKSDSAEALFYKHFKLISNDFINKKIIANNLNNSSRTSIITTMLNNKTITTKLPEADLLRIINNYNTICTIRNSINHASAAAIKNFKKMAQDDLDTLSKYVNDK